MEKENTSLATGQIACELLVDSGSFWERLSADITSARQSVYIQTLSFEGDSAGRGLADSVKASAAGDKRIIVDNYTRYVLSDKFLFSPKNWFDKELWHEVKATRNMIDGLRQNGVGVRFVNPVGLLLTKMPSRNHKKMIIIDGHISYIGGINFSDHNFAWHDLMLRLENPGIAAFLTDDFLMSWNGKHFGGRRRFDGIELFAFNGATNKTDFEPLFDLINAARSSIYVQSPYLCHPFTDRLRAAVSRGVNITVVTPEKNNKKPVQEYIIWEAARSGFVLRYYQGGMTHMKAMLIDDEILIVGSCNFDSFSYWFEQETVAVITDRRIIDSFVERVVRPDDANCSKKTLPPRRIMGYVRDLEIRAATRLMGLFNGK
jgi:cardiolipin synthase